MVTASTSIWDKATPLALTQSPIIHCLLMCATGASQAATLALELSVNLSKSLCKFFMMNSCDSSNPLSHSAAISASIYSFRLWGFLFLVLEPWTREPAMGLGPGFQERLPQLR